MDPLSLFAAAVAAGLLAGPSDGPSRRAQVLRVRRSVRGHTTSPWPFLELYGLRSDDPSDDDGLWHVTTGLSSVLREGLISRRESGKIGLGGGPNNQGPDQVSVTWSHSDAVRVYEAMRLALDAARGVVSAAEVVAGFREQNDAVLDEVRHHEDYLLDDGQMTEAEGIDFQLADRLGFDDFRDLDLEDPSVVRHLDERFPTGRSRYELLQELEEDAVDALQAPKEMSSDGLSCGTTVGFTAPWHRFVQIDPLDVAILRLSADRRSVTDVVPEEKELRFTPEDLRVVGFDRPAWPDRETASVSAARTTAVCAWAELRPDAMAFPTAFLDAGMQGSVFSTEDPAVVVRVGPADDRAQEMFLDEEVCGTGGVVRTLGGAEVGPRVVAWRERVDPYVEGFLRRRYGDGADEVLHALLGLYDLRREKLRTLEKYPETRKLAAAIRAGLPTSDLDLSSNLGVTVAGDVVAYDL